MEDVKTQVRTLLDQLPDDCTIDDLQYHLYVLEKIRIGEESLEKDAGIPHDEVKTRVREWLRK
jgi:hypothetical protein